MNKIKVWTYVFSELFIRWHCIVRCSILSVSLVTQATRRLAVIVTLDSVQNTRHCFSLSLSASFIHAHASSGKFNSKHTTAEAS